jgi:hypothetical protein
VVLVAVLLLFQLCDKIRYEKGVVRATNKSVKRSEKVQSWRGSHRLTWRFCLGYFKGMRFFVNTVGWHFRHRWSVQGETGYLLLLQTKKPVWWNMALAETDALPKQTQKL